MSGGTGSYQRTKNSLRNSLVAVGFQVISLLIGFWSRRIFLNHLGTEVLGLNTTAQSLLGFLNLAELGIGSAIAVTLYKPIFDDDRRSIREIVALQGWLYKIVACIVVAGSVVLGFFLPSIFSKTDLPIWYAYASFAVFLYGSMLSYFVNYKQIVLDAYQLNYKIQLATKTVSIAKLAAQALTVKYLDNGFLWWLGLEAAASTLMAILLSRTVHRTVPFIREKVGHPSLLRKKYPDVTVKVKQLFVHKIAGFVLSQAVPLIIYAYATLTLVAEYGNYQVLTTNLERIMASLFLGLTASVGNLVASGDTNLSLKVFRELFSIRYFMTAVCCICLWFLVEPFITLWIGEGYLLGRTSLLLIIVVFYIACSRTAVDVYLHAYGLFRDIWAPIAEASLCLLLSILFGRHYGLNGILLGQIIAQTLIVKLWKPVFLFRCGFKLPVIRYFSILGKHLAAVALTCGAMYFVWNHLPVNPFASFGYFFIDAFILFVLCAAVLFCLLYASESGMRGFVKRIMSLFPVRE